MKSIRLYAFLLFSLVALNGFSATASADPDQDFFSELGNAFRSGSVKDISKYFAATVDITLPSADDQYSKAQAEVMLKNFFDSHSPNGFKLEHQGASSNGKYMVGSLTTSKGTFKVYVFVKDSGGQRTISELKIENP
jgi:hypothetical protein